MGLSTGEAPQGSRDLHTTKILAGHDPAKRADGSLRNKIENAWKNSFGREHLWIRKDEAEALSQGALPESLKKRIACYPLVDNTRGTPTGWKETEIKKLELSLKDGRLAGSVHFETETGDRGYQAEVLGFVESKDGKLTRLDAVVKGQFWGEGKHTPGAPKGKFPLGHSIKLADPKDMLYGLVPHAVRSYADYLK